MQNRHDIPIPELVTAARAGDPHARERLVSDCLPLVYNIVGRALDGHADVDDVVQETMFRALDGLGGLREPTGFRSWLVAIAMNQIRRRWNARQQTAVTSLDLAPEAPDPTGDFTDLSILRLGLSGQRREVAEATRWLDADDRHLLALWWQEAAGTLTRAELAAALDTTPQHTAVRVKRMKDQLEVARVVVRALASEPRCPTLATVTTAWDGRPAPLWRKRIARHARTCRRCAGHWTDLVPAEGLLAGLALVLPLSGAGTPSWLSGPAGTVAHGTALPADGAAGPQIPAAAPSGHPAPAPTGPAAPAGPSPAAPNPPATAPGTPGSPGPAPADGAADSGTTGAALPNSGTTGTPPTYSATTGTPLPSSGSTGVQPPGPGASGPDAAGGSRARRSAAVAGGLLAGGVVLALLWPSGRAPAERPSVAAPPSTRTPATESPAPAPTPSTTTARPSSPPPKRTPRAAEPSRRPRTTPAAPRQEPGPGPEQRLTSLVNAARADAGCAPLRIDPRLSAAARTHARDMAARHYYDHANPEGEHADARISAAGYDWSRWAENLNRGPSDPARVVDSWTDGSIHEENMLDCRYRDTGVAAVPGSEGTLWVQELAEPG
ncbi:sigma-70 family RNA polymerase sigma factor [Streptomyces sp. bgisy100]|uniref:sigma-70 family RNA polymerase sigma factor n=1 Tax=Streptomyces sp. bgisy100 TaxID=3413783 RepID=UPI003D716A6B